MKSKIWLKVWFLIGIISTNAYAFPVTAPFRFNYGTFELSEQEADYRFHKKLSQFIINNKVLTIKDSQNPNKIYALSLESKEVGQTKEPCLCGLFSNYKPVISDQEPTHIFFSDTLTASLPVGSKSQPSPEISIEPFDIRSTNFSGDISKDDQAIYCQHLADFLNKMNRTNSRSGYGLLASFKCDEDGILHGLVQMNYLGQNYAY